MNSYYANVKNIREENNCTFFSPENIFGRISRDSKGYTDFLKAELLLNSLSKDNLVFGGRKMETKIETDNYVLKTSKKYFIQKLPITSKENNGVYEMWAEWGDD